MSDNNKLLKSEMKGLILIRLGITGDLNIGTKQAHLIYHLWRISILLSSTYMYVRFMLQMVRMYVSFEIKLPECGFKCA